MKRLIVSGDDFGIHRLINQGIIDAHRNGILTSASIVACGQAFDDAVSLARANPELGVGIHLTFVAEIPLSKCEDIESLVGSDGRFPPSWKSMLFRLITGRIRWREIQQEAEAQIARVLDSGITPTHVDSHQHLHLFPALGKRLLPVIQKFGIPGIRLAKRELIANQRGWKSLGLEYLSRRSAPDMDRAGIWSPDHVAGTSLGGRLTVESVDRLLSELPDGTTELICHPGADNEELAKCYQWDYDWNSETRALTSPVLRRKIADLGIQLSRFEASKGCCCCPQSSVHGVIVKCAEFGREEI